MHAYMYTADIFMPHRVKAPDALQLLYAIDNKKGLRNVLHDRLLASDLTDRALIGMSQLINPQDDYHQMRINM